MFTRKFIENFLQGYTAEEIEEIKRDLAVVMQFSLSRARPQDSFTAPLYIATAGGPGSIKSTTLESFLRENNLRRQVVYADPDAVSLRNMAYTYRQSLTYFDFATAQSNHSALKTAYDKWRGASNYINHEIMQIAFGGEHGTDGKYSIAHGTTSTSPNIGSLYQRIKSRGYQISLLLCNSSDEIKRQAIERREKEQGFVQSDPKDVVEKGKMFPERFDTYFQYADELRFYWNNELTHGKLPTLCAHYVKTGSTFSLTILNEKDWVRFCEKYLQDVKAFHIPICHKFEILIPEELRATFAERDREAIAVTEIVPVTESDMASFIKEIEIQALHDKIALTEIPPTSSEYQNVEGIKAEAQSRLAQMQTTTTQAPAMALPAAEKPLVQMQTPAAIPLKLPAAVKSPQRNYDDIQRTSNRISEIDERIFNSHVTKNCYWQRTLMLIELWNEKKDGHYLGELSAEHILKSFTTVIMEDANDPTYWVKRGNFYAQLGDRAGALADFEKATTLPASENVLAAFCYNNDLSDLERAISALPTTGTTQGQSQPLAPLTIDEIKIQKFQREIALFDMQLAMTPNHAESLILKAYAFSQLAGLLQWETSVAEKVTRAYDTAIQCAPNTYLYLRRAGSHLKRNNFGAALHDIFTGTTIPYQPNTQANILKYINTILIGNYKNDSGLQNTFERFRVEKNILETTLEAWFNALAKKYQPVVTEDPVKCEIRLLQQQLQEQKKIHDAHIAELRGQVASLQQSTQRPPVETAFGSSALFVKRDARI